MSYALGAEVEFVRNNATLDMSLWKIKKWDDGQSMYLLHHEVKCNDQAKTSDSGLLVYAATADDNKYRVILNRVGHPHKIRLRCKQEDAKLLANLKSPEPPVTPEPGSSVINVNICDKTSIHKHLPKVLLDRIESSVQLKAEEGSESDRCYFQLDQETMDKANFEFQKGMYRFSFQYARMTCDRYGAQLLSFDVLGEVKHLAKNYDHWKSEEFYAIGATVGKPRRILEASAVAYFDVKLDVVDSTRFRVEWVKSIDGLYHPDEKDAAGVVFSQNLGMEHGWFVLQHSVGIYKAVRFICVQNLEKLDLSDPKVTAVDGDGSRSKTPANIGQGGTSTDSNGAGGRSSKPTQPKVTPTKGAEGSDGTITKERKGPSPSRPAHPKQREDTIKPQSTTGRGSKYESLVALIAIGLVAELVCG